MTSSAFRGSSRLRRRRAATSSPWGGRWPSCGPGAALAVVAGGGAFGRFAGDAFVRAAEGLGLRLAGRLGFADPPARIAASSPDAVFACGPAQREVELFRTLASLLPDVLRGGASPGLAAFPELLGGDPEGFLAPVQWPPGCRHRPGARAELGGGGG